MFRRDLGTRQKTYESVIKSGKQCIAEQKVEEPSSLEEVLDELVVRWDALIMMSNTKQERLENALKLAQEFESGVKEKLRMLKNMDTKLRSFGPVADNIDGVYQQLDEMKVNWFKRELLYAAKGSLAIFVFSFLLNFLKSVLY